MSYGQCEAENGAAGNAAFYNAYQSAAAAGVSVFVSSGDESATSCSADASSSTTGIGVSGWTSTPYNVSVGGTDFEDTYNASKAGNAHHSRQHLLEFHQHTWLPTALPSLTFRRSPGTIPAPVTCFTTMRAKVPPYGTPPASAIPEAPATAAPPPAAAAPAAAPPARHPHLTLSAERAPDGPSLRGSRASSATPPTAYATSRTSPCSPPTASGTLHHHLRHRQFR
jgi:hypothetical protein